MVAATAVVALTHFAGGPLLEVGQVLRPARRWLAPIFRPAIVNFAGVTFAASGGDCDRPPSKRRSPTAAARCFCSTPEVVLLAATVLRSHQESESSASAIPSSLGHLDHLSCRSDHFGRLTDRCETSLDDLQVSDPSCTC